MHTVWLYVSNEMHVAENEHVWFCKYNLLQENWYLFFFKSRLVRNSQIADVSEYQLSQLEEIHYDFFF